MCVLTEVCGMARRYSALQEHSVASIQAATYSHTEASLYAKLLACTENRLHICGHKCNMAGMLTLIGTKKHVSLHQTIHLHRERSHIAYIYIILYT
jgi:hypothetical protein